MIILFWWIFGIYTTIALIVTIGATIDNQDFPLGLAYGLLWLFWLTRSVFRNILWLLKR
jgi:hypothetical protein